MTLEEFANRIDLLKTDALFGVDEPDDDPTGPTGINTDGMDPIAETELLSALAALSLAHSHALRSHRIQSRAAKFRETARPPCGMERKPFNGHFAHVDGNGSFWLEDECPVCKEIRVGRE